MPDFAKRMFTYNYKIFDRYGKDVISLAILTDGNKNFRPNIYRREFLGFKLNFEFPIVKLIDLKDKINKNSSNPFEIITNTHIKELDTKNKTNERLLAKIELVKNLYSIGLNKEDILLLYEFIDYIVSLPDDINLKFHESISKFEEEKKMPYITTAERIGIEKGRKEMQQSVYQAHQALHQEILNSIKLILELKFASKGVVLYPMIAKIKDNEALKIIQNSIVRDSNLNEIKELINNFKDL